MATMASVKVFAPFAAYPSFASVRNRNWLRTDTSYKPEGVEVTYLNYPALPAISRPFNGLTCARTVLPHVEREHVDVILSYWLYPDAYAATIVGKRLDEVARLLGKSPAEAVVDLVEMDHGNIGVARFGMSEEDVRLGLSKPWVALGTDCGGSVRIPASYCGIIGLRPTHGRVSDKGVLPFAPSFDVVGWFARDIALFANVGDVLLGKDTAAAPTRLIVADDAWEQVEKPVAETLRPANGAPNQTSSPSGTRSRTNSR